jgi:outer membrane protein TolC
MSVLLLAGCTVQPVPLERTERDQVAAESRHRLFEAQEPITAPLTLYDAAARAIRYQADVRVRLMEEAVTLGQLDVAKFELLPALTANAGYSTRNNDAFGFGFSPGGTVATNPTASVERDRTTASIGFTWNLLDFGVGYFRARQLADQSLIAEERRRRALQNLLQDVRLAWWRAEAAQRLLPQIDLLFEEVDQTIEKTRVIETRRLLPPLQTASLRRALLDLKQQIAARRIDLEQSRLELAALVNAPPGTDVRVVAASGTPAAPLDLSTSLDALEAVALRNRPEIAEEVYKSRISESEARKAMLGIVPRLSVDLTRNYDSNRFLVNNTWTSAGLAIAFNLVRAFSRQALDRTAEAQRELDEARRLAVAMAVITQTRIAAVRYGLLLEEFGVWDEATQDDEQIVSFLASSAEVGIDTELELIRAKARHLVSKINRDLVHANVESALARVYGSVGLDVLPERMETHEPAEIARQLRTRVEEWQKNNFTARQPPPALPVAVGEIIGVPAQTAGEFRNAMGRILQLSKLTVVESDKADLRVSTAVSVEPLRNGGRPVVVRVRLVDAKTGSVQFSSEFRTTLSEPVDEEQWRTLGEGAAYRVAGPVARMQSGRTALVRQPPAAPRTEAPESPSLAKAPVAADPVTASEPAAPVVESMATAFDGEPLGLRIDDRLRWPQRQDLSRVETYGVPRAH